MVERAGASCALSVFIVILATVVLHQAEKKGQIAAIPGPKKPAKAKPASPARNVAAEPAPKAVAGDESPRRPQGPFTRAKENESLADVVRRVYGPKASVEAFWKLNRDQVAEIDTPLKPGTLLRTPEL